MDQKEVEGGDSSENSITKMCILDNYFRAIQYRVPMIDSERLNKFRSCLLHWNISEKTRVSTVLTFQRDRE
jgi:hypothetical protein